VPSKKKLNEVFKTRTAAEAYAASVFYRLKVAVRIVEVGKAKPEPLPPF
jgi:hypothetical protein